MDGVGWDISSLLVLAYHIEVYQYVSCMRDILKSYMCLRRLALTGCARGAAPG